MILKENKIPLTSGATSKEVLFTNVVNNPNPEFLSVVVVDLTGKAYSNIQVSISEITPESFTVEFNPSIPSSGYFINYVYSEEIKSCDVIEIPAIEFNTDIGYVVEDDSWVGIPSIELLIDGDPPNDALDKVTFSLSKSPNSSPVLTLTEVDGIVINDVDLWTLTISPILDFPLSAGTYYFKLKTEDVLGFKQTWISGRLFVTTYPVSEIV